jgi:membrane protein
LSTATDPEPSPAFGQIPSSPYRLGFREWIAVFKRAIKQFLADDCIGLSAQIAFSALLAFFPAMILLVGVLGLFGEDTYDAVGDLIGRVAPSQVTDAVEIAKESSASNTGASTLALLLGGALAIWTASGAMGAVMKAVNRAYDRVETRPVWKRRLTAIVLVVVSGTVVAGMFVLIVFGGPLGEAVADKADLGGAFELTWTLVRWPLAFAVLLFFFALVYYAAPNIEQRSWKWLTPGSIVGAVAWLALSGLFALYTSFAGSYDKTYGSLAGGIVLLLWLNYSAFALLFGAELNSELDRQADTRAAGGENAGLVMPARRSPGVTRSP